MKKLKDKKRIISIIALAVGIITLIVGVVFLIVRFNSAPALDDAEYLVEKRSWRLEGGDCEELKCGDATKCLDAAGEPMQSCNGDGVIWTFTEIGKGTLTTNNHQNDYDFIWAIEDNKLKIETSWLYKMNNEYDYKLDQNAGTLTLDGDIVFKVGD